MLLLGFQSLQQPQLLLDMTQGESTWLVVVVQVSFLAYAFGGGVGHQLNFQPRYKGRDLAFMHSHMVEKGLTMDHFDSVLRHFCQTLRQLNMPQVGFNLFLALVSRPLFFARVHPLDMPCRHVAVV